jgi:hypothetical protein
VSACATTRSTARPASSESRAVRHHRHHVGGPHAGKTFVRGIFTTASRFRGRCATRHLSTCRAKRRQRPSRGVECGRSAATGPSSGCRSTCTCSYTSRVARYSPGGVARSMGDLERGPTNRPIGVDTPLNAGRADNLVGRRCNTGHDRLDSVLRLRRSITVAGRDALRLTGRSLGPELSDDHGFVASEPADGPRQSINIIRRRGSRRIARRSEPEAASRAPG